MQTLDRVIHKFILADYEGGFKAVDPVVLHVGFDPKVPAHAPAIWVELSLDQNGQTPEHATEFKVHRVSTGHIVPEGVSYLGTVVYPDGLVDHVYGG